MILGAGAGGGRGGSMIDVGFVAKTRYFRKGLALEVTILNVDKCSWCGS